MRVTLLRSSWASVPHATHTTHTAHAAHTTSASPLVDTVPTMGAPHKKSKLFHHLGIQGKILFCFLLVIALFLVLTVVTQYQSIQLSQRYEQHLSDYLLVHRFRLNLNSFHALTDRYLREPTSVDIDAVYAGILSLNMEYTKLVPLGDSSIPVEFEVRATGYGLDVYLPLISKAVGLRAGKSPDYYQSFIKASRIHGYIDTYLNRMLSELMKNGEETYANLSRRSKRLNMTILISMFLASAFAVGVVFFITESITGPLRHLAREAEKLANGDLTAGIIESHSHDEVETLAKSFASMAASIRDMVDGIKEKATLERLLHEEELALVSMGKSLREAQFLNLQEQMKPHFLFNALNTIARSALLEDASRTESLALSLATLMRATLRDSGPLSTLEEELRSAEAYLSFQQVRFGERLSWRIDVPEPLYPLRIPRFTIQPLVENSVHHAIEPKIDGGRLVVKVRQRKGLLYIWILDNGLGMSYARLLEVRSRIAGSLSAQCNEDVRFIRSSAPSGPFEADDERIIVDAKGLGLSNLATRFGILYGSACRFQIRSIEGKGTLVRMVIPLDESVL